MNSDAVAGQRVFAARPSNGGRCTESAGRKDGRYSCSSACPRGGPDSFQPPL